MSNLFGRKVKGHTLANSTDVAMDLVERAAVAVVPGDAFEAPSNIRISFACSAERINEGMDRIAKAYA